MDSYSDDDLIPLNGGEMPMEDDMIPLPVDVPLELPTIASDLNSATKHMDDLMQRHGGTLFLSQETHIAVLEKLLEKFTTRTFVKSIDTQLAQLVPLGLDDVTIIRMIAEGIPPSPIKHMQLARERAELGEVALRHLLEKLGLGDLAKQKIADIEQLLLAGRSFEFIHEMITN
jgi:hypothetical protein